MSSFVPDLSSASGHLLSRGVDVLHTDWWELGYDWSKTKPGNSPIKHVFVQQLLTYQEQSKNANITTEHLRQKTGPPDSDHLNTVDLREKWQAYHVCCLPCRCRTQQINHIHMVGWWLKRNQMKMDKVIDQYSCYLEQTILYNNQQDLAWRKLLSFLLGDDGRMSLMSTSEQKGIRE
jgi:hypothetical protein